MTEVIIIGAGPYGLSIAAHLRAQGIDYRIFGEPMGNWRTKMPRGMQLKSDGFASNLIDPDGAFTLKEFCRQQGCEYADEGIPVPIETFVDYGEAFQRRFVGAVEQRMVVGLDRTSDGFAARLDDGEIVVGQKVVIGIGISDFPYMPKVLADIPLPFRSHAASHTDPAQLCGREVIVVGSGSSAIDLAVLMHEAGVSVRLVARRELRFHTRTEIGAGRSWMERLREPNTGIGPGWRNVFYCETPQLFRYVSEEKRVRIIRGSHGPAGGWYMRDRILGQLPIMEGCAPQGAEIRDNRVHLQVAKNGGAVQTVSGDHVVVCTGYKVDVGQIKFLGEKLRRQIATLDQAPVLSPHFESSVPGLYVVGPAAAYSFGPMFRFVFGAEFTTPRIVRHLAASVARRPSVRGPVVQPG